MRLDEAVDELERAARAMALNRVRVQCRAKLPISAAAVIPWPTTSPIAIPTRPVR